MAIFVQGIDLACRAATLRDRLFSEYRVVSITTGEKLSQNAKIISYAVQRVSPLVAFTGTQKNEKTYATKERY